MEEQTVGGWKETRREEWRGTKRDESEWEAGGGGDGVRSETARNKRKNKRSVRGR